MVQLGDQALPGHGEDFRVVEGKRGSVVDVEPTHLAGIGGGAWCDAVKPYEGVVGDRDHAFPRVPVRAAEAVQLLEVDVSDAGFFFQFPARAVIQAFVGFHETARQRPAVAKWLPGALDQQNLQRVPANREDDDIGSNGGMRMFVGVRHLSLGFRRARSAAG